MKKFKNLSNEFVLSVGLLLASFFIFQAAVLPSIFNEDNLTASVAIYTKDTFKIERSRINPDAYVFDYKFDTRTISPQKGENFFDLPIIPFDRENVSIDINEAFAVTDAWGYPVRENAFMKLSRGGEKRGGGERSDEDPDVLGLVNCRENESVTGYFKAYFEDVALGNGFGYDDETYGPARREEVCIVLQDIAELIKLDETEVTPDIIFMADPGNMPPGALAAASAYFGYYSAGPDNGSLHRHIISEQDPTPDIGNFDAFVLTNFNNGVSWDVDSDLNPTTYDFYTVISHEVLHALGFRGLLPAVVSSTNDQHSHDTFDYFSFKDSSLVDPFINQTNSNLETPVGAPSLWFITNEVVYRGTKNLVGAMPDGIRPVYSPLDWQQGSSLSHFDMDRASGETYIMHPNISTNIERDIHDHEKETLCHLGYRLDGIVGCEDSTPWAGDDFYSIDIGETICINPLINDQSFVGGNLLINSFSSIDIQAGDIITYYQDDDCVGSVLPDAEGAKSFDFLAATGTNTRKFTYKIKDLTSERISFPAEIQFISCNDILGEYVCNGDFETDHVDEIWHSSYCEGNVWNPADTIPYWCNSFGSPDWLPYSYPNFAWMNWYPFECIDCNGGNRYIEVVRAILPGYFDNAEGAITQLKEPLIPGEEYVLSFDVFARAGEYTFTYDNQEWQYDANAIESTHVVASLNAGPQISSNYFSTPMDQVVLDQVIPFNLDPNTFTHIEHNFSPDEAYDFFGLEGYYVGEGVIVTTYSFDNVSIRKAQDNSANIKGTVYYDQNENGVLDQGENGLTGVSVSIVEEGQQDVFMTLLTEDMPTPGEYSFYVPEGEYSIVLTDEFLFTGITQPIQNNILSGYEHARVTSISAGVDSDNNDFGVVLDDNNPDQANLHLKKGLIDSTLSVFDRNITWSVEVTNYGPEAAHNINILDLPPTPLVYYSHVTPYPNTYNSGTGIWHIPQLNVGETAYIQITMKVPSGTCGTKINTATLQSFDEADTDPSDNIATSQIKLRNCGNVLQTVK